MKIVTPDSLETIRIEFYNRSNINIERYNIDHYAVTIAGSGDYCVKTTLSYDGVKYFYKQLSYFIFEIEDKSVISYSLLRELQLNEINIQLRGSGVATVKRYDDQFRMYFNTLQLSDLIRYLKSWLVNSLDFVLSA